MKTTRHFRLASMFALVAAASAAADSGPVTVIFSHPEKYADVRDSFGDNDNARGRERYLPFIQEHLTRAGARRLPAGQQLTVTFSDIDLAGDFEPGRGMHFDDIRVIKDLYVPRLSFTFTLTDASGAVLKSGERKLVELGFQMTIRSGFRDDQLRYEKAMLDDWLRREFATRKG